MSEDSDEFKSVIKGIVERVGGSSSSSKESAAKFQAHLKLNEFSKSPWGRGETELEREQYRETCRQTEIASFAVMMHCANDINRPNRVLLSPYDQQLNQTHIKIAGVSLNRDDIDEIEGTRSDMPLCLKSDFGVANMGQVVVQPHPHASREHAFDLSSWMEPRLDALRYTVESGAEIISFSEFDFPVETAGQAEAQAADEIVSKEIQKILDGAGRPIFLVAGSRHEPNNHDQTRGWGNVAKIFTSSELRTQTQGRMTPLEMHIDHPKRVSAISAGEKITTPNDTNITYYETSLGVIGVLICVDAYSPNILFSLINSRRADETTAHPSRNDIRKRLDYIIVPAYNRSRKLYYACQVLSLMCETTVILVDGWRREPKKPAQTALFICGRLFSDIRETEEEIGNLHQHPENKNLRIWDLSLMYVRNFRQRRFLGTPTLNQAEKQTALLPAELRPTK